MYQSSSKEWPKLSHSIRLVALDPKHLGRCLSTFCCNFGNCSQLPAGTRFSMFKVMTNLEILSRFYYFFPRENLAIV